MSADNRPVSEPSKQRTNTAIKQLFILAAAVLFAFLAGRFYFVSGDDGTYIALARALRAGTYQAINVPGNPVQTQYPPLFPLLLYPVANMPPGNIGLIRLWVACWSLLAVIPIVAAAGRRDPEIPAIAAALPFFVSPLFGEYSTSILTESIFVMLAYAVLTRVGDELERDAGGSRPSSPTSCAKSALNYFTPTGLLAACLLRSSGIALVAAVLAIYVFRRHYRSAVICLIFVGVGMSPWWLWQNFHASDYVRSHLMQADIYDPSAGTLSTLEIFTVRIPHNLSRYIGRIFADVLLAPYFRSVAPWTPLFPAKVLASVTLFLAVILGFARRVRSRGLSVEELYVIFSCGLFLLHPVFADRYLYAILPSLIGYLLLAFRRPQIRIRAAIVLGAISILGCVLALEAPIPKEEAAYIEAVSWLEEHAHAQGSGTIPQGSGAREAGPSRIPPDIVMARKPSAVWFYTGCQAQAYPSTTDTNVWAATQARFAIRDDYTIGVHTAKKYFDPIVANTRLFSPVFTSGILPDVKVYERNRP